MTLPPYANPDPGPWNPPDWNEPDLPEGHGEPRPPKGGFKVEAKDLVQAAAVWDEVSAALKTVWDKAQVGWGYPGIFGAADALMTAGTMHMDINEILVNAAADGHFVTAAIADGLIEVANDYSDTDKVAGDNFRTLQDRA